MGIIDVHSVPDSRVLDSGTITRDSDGLISSIVKTNRTLAIMRNDDGFVTSIDDGTYIKTYIRDSKNNITSWSVA